MQHMDEIIAGCIQNDRKSQHELYKNFAPTMLGVCRRYTSSKEEAEDIMIEGFLNVFKRIGSFRHDCSLSSWIRAIMVNAAIDHYRSNKKHQLDDCLDEATLQTGHFTHTGEEIITKLEAKQIMLLLNEMPDDFRVIFNLRVIEEYSFKEIAEELSRNENTIRVYFQRARTWLQQRIQVQEKR